jgi:hypothetical protein
MWYVDASELSNCLNPWQFEMFHFKSQGSDAGENLNKEHQRCSVLNFQRYKNMS